MTFTIPLTFGTGIIVGFAAAVILMILWNMFLDHIGLGKN